jgi:hypothetical protein
MLLTLELLEALRTPEGEALIRAADELRAEPLRAIEALRRRGAPELARAAYEQALLRPRAAAKFSRAETMFFTRPLLEQASAEVVAAHRARRFADFAAAADLCCGVGGDALALAAVTRTLAVDADPLAARLTVLNAAAHGHAPALGAVVARIPEFVPRVPAAFIDPGRRRESGAVTPGAGGRTTRVEEMSPPLSAILSLLDALPNLGIKLSPAVSHHELDGALARLEHEREAISVAGECRELVVWTGALAGCPRRATLLPGGQSLVGTGGEELDIRAPGCYLYEPDAAVIRARLVARAAAELGAWGIDPALAYLSSDGFRALPWAAAYRIEGPQPFSRKSLTELLRRRGAGDVVLKTRGFAARPEELQRQLGLRGGQRSVCPVVFLTRLGGRAMMIVGERVGAGTDPNGD